MISLCFVFALLSFLSCEMCLVCLGGERPCAVLGGVLCFLLVFVLYFVCFRLLSVGPSRLLWGGKNSLRVHLASGSVFCLPVFGLPLLFARFFGAFLSFFSSFLSFSLFFVSFLALTFAFSLFQCIGVTGMRMLCVCCARCILYDGVALHCLLCLLHCHVVSLCRGFVTAEIASL